MAFEQGSFEGGEDEAAETERLSSLWLADLQALPNFTPQDKYLLDRIMKADRAVSMFANMQRRRQHLESLEGGEDTIAHQLQTLRDVFGKP